MLTLHNNVMVRFGKCEIYSGGVEVCQDVVRPLIDRIYITKSYGDFSSILNNEFKTCFDFFASDDKDCIKQVFRVMCHYYFPPCGSFSHSLPPSSICQEECSQVQSECHDTWQMAAAVLYPIPFIDCNDTSRLIFPLPNCCTGAGIMIGTRDEVTSSASMLPTPTPLGM